MKKWMCLLLALVTVFSLTACGDQDEKREEETQNTTQTTGDTQPAETLQEKSRMRWIMRWNCWRPSPIPGRV